MVAGVDVAGVTIHRRPTTTPQPNSSWPSWFFSSLARGISYFLMDTKNTTERVEEKEQTIGLGLAPSARGRKSVQLSVHLQAIAGVYLRETFSKPLGILTHLLELVNPASVGQPVLAATFLTSVDWSPLFLTLIS